MKRQKIKYMIVRNSFDFFANYNGKSIYSVCKLSKIKDSGRMYDTYDLMREGGIIDNLGKLTKKGEDLQKKMIKLNELLKYIG